MRPALLLLLTLLAACNTPRPALTPSVQAINPDEHQPPFVRQSFEPYSRVNAIAIAQREWRAFGSLVDDASPGSEPPSDFRPDKQPGLWQRVAEYWWLGQDAGTAESGWSSRYTENGTPYTRSAPAWSAAFISYVMRSAAAGTRFPYSPLHADYINAAARGEGAIRAERPESYAPQPGDLICYGRQSARSMRFDELPATRFFGHCDIVTAAQPGQLTVIGGNVVASVTTKHVPTTAQGMLADPAGTVIDSRYPWFVVLRVQYDA